MLTKGWFVCQSVKMVFSEKKKKFRNYIIRPRKKYMRGSGYSTYPKFLPPTLNFFLQILKLEEIVEQNNFVLLFSSNFRIWRKNTYQNNNLKWKSKCLCIQSLVLEVKGLKQGYIFKLDPFISVLSYSIPFQTGLNIPRKIVFWKK